MPASSLLGQQPTCRSFEEFLSQVEDRVHALGHLLLLTDGHLRLVTKLLRHPANPRVHWGLKIHEDWAVKATLLRFAAGRESLEVILSEPRGDSCAVWGWFLKRTSSECMAWSVSEEEARRTWNRCLQDAALETPATV